MKLMTQVTAIAVAVCFFAATCSANFVIDDFSNATSASSGATITTSNFVFTSGQQSASLAAGGTASITYDFGTTTIGDPSLQDPAIPTPPIDLLIPAVVVDPGDFQLTITSDGFGPIVLSPFTSPFVSIGPGLAAATNLTFTFENISGGPGTVALGGAAGTLQAIPEPTALLMFGSVVGLGLIRRRGSSIA